MGWFSKTVPERKWVSTVAILAHELQRAAGSWQPDAQGAVVGGGSRPAPVAINEVARHYLSILQLSAVAATLHENGYVSDATFLLELSYTALTERQPSELHRDIVAYPFARAGEAKESLTLWAYEMADELSIDLSNPTLMEQLVRSGFLLVIQAKIATCEACGDQKGAARIRRSLRD